MDSRKLGASATAVAVCLGLVFGLFSVQGWTITAWMAVPLLVVLSVAVAVALLVALDEVRKGATHLSSQWRLTSPVVRKDAPSPHQWLLEIASQDEKSPTNGVTILQRRIMRWSLDGRRPFVVFGVTVFSGLVYDAEFSDVQGSISFAGEPLEIPPELEGGGATRIARGQPYELRIVQYIPRELVDAVHEELARGTTGSFGLSGATIQVRANKEEASTVRMSIGGNDRIAVGS